MALGFPISLGRLCQPTRMVLHPDDPGFGLNAHSPLPSFKNQSNGPIGIDVALVSCRVTNCPLSVRQIHHGWLYFRANRGNYRYQALQGRNASIQLLSLQPGVKAKIYKVTCLVNVDLPPHNTIRSIEP